jgi:hypothetical protein
MSTLNIRPTKYLIKALNKKRGITETIDTANSYLTAISLKREYQKAWGITTWDIFIEPDKKKKGFYNDK